LTRKDEPTRTKGRRQHVVGSQKYIFEQIFKEAQPKQYGLFKISKDIGQEVFQLELLKRWIIHNVFNEDLLTQYKKPQFKGQHMKPALSPNIINEKK